MYSSSTFTMPELVHEIKFFTAALLFIREYSVAFLSYFAMQYSDLLIFKILPLHYFDLKLSCLSVGNRHFKIIGLTAKNVNLNLQHIYRNSIPTKT